MDNDGIGKKVLYSLTDKAVKQLRLSLIGVPRYKIIIFKKIYKAILFNDISKNLVISAESEDAFDKTILAELRVNRNDLSWERVSVEEDIDGSNLLNDSSSEKDHRSFICYPLASRGNFDVILKRIEYWQINRSENTKYRQEYLCGLSGFSIEEILALGFKEDDVNFAFNALRDLKLIEPSIEFRGNTRFIISDRKLHELLKNLWFINEVEIPRMLVKWKYFEEHTTNEENRMKRLIGKQEANWFFRKSSIMRSQHNLKLKKFKTTEEYNQYVKKEHFSYHRELDLDANLEVFKEKIRGNRTIVTTKEKRDDLLQYLNFLKKILFNYLKHLPFSRDQNIDKFRMENREILGKYIFLQPLLKDICPKAFEVNDESESKVKIANSSPVDN